MKTINYALVRILFAIVISLVLLFFPDNAMNYMVMTIGVLFLIPGLIALIANLLAKKTEDGKARRFPVEGLGSILLGLFLMIKPDLFTTILMWLLGAVLALGAIYQIASLLAARQWVRVPFAFFIVPVLVLIAGVTALFNPTGVISTTLMIIGIAGLVYSASELVNWIKFASRKPKATVMIDKQQAEEAEIVG